MPNVIHQRAEILKGIETDFMIGERLLNKFPSRILYLLIKICDND